MIIKDGAQKARHACVGVDVCDRVRGGAGWMPFNVRGVRYGNKGR